jgi:hypothetical protein
MTIIWAVPWLRPLVAYVGIHAWVLDPPHLQEKKTIIFLKIYTLTYWRRAVIIALQTSGINLEMDALNILNKHINLPSESPVARYLNVTANLSLAEIACQKDAFFREINGDTICSNSSNPVGVMRMTFLKPLLSSMRNSLKSELYAQCDFLSFKNVRTHHLGPLPISLLLITMKETFITCDRQNTCSSVTQDKLVRCS